MTLWGRGYRRSQPLDTSSHLSTEKTQYVANTIYLMAEIAEESNNYGYDMSLRENKLGHAYAEARRTLSQEKTCRNEAIKLRSPFQIAEMSRERQ
jgi:hypothetical protein